MGSQRGRRALFPYAFHVIGKAVTLGFLALMSLTQALFTWRFVPETKNKPLEEIEQHWLAPNGAPAICAVNSHRQNTAPKDSSLANFLLSILIP